MAQSQFVTYVLDQLQPVIGHMRSKPMFGGYGIYHQDVIVGIIVNDTLYLKADEQTRHRYLSQSLKPFTYLMPNGRQLEMSYYEAPTVDDAATLGTWVKEAFDASQRDAKNNKTKKTVRAKD